MIYTCPKCGKKMDLSTEVLINSGYKVVCPQCLCELQIIGDYAYIPHEELKLDTTIEPSRTINCPKCGHEASTGAHFCPNCGASFDTHSTTALDISPEDVTVLPPPLPDQDPLYHEALKFLANCSAITPMMLRDRFHISNERAAELLRQLEQGGAVGPYNNGGPRQILIPHRRLYEAPRPILNDTNTENTPRRTQVPRTGGCLTWVLIFLFLSFLIRACSG
jgi:DNA-directed RNA polymerase subunit RPC12/RpoP